MHALITYTFLIGNNFILLQNYKLSCRVLQFLKIYEVNLRDSDTFFFFHTFIKYVAKCVYTVFR